MGGKGKVYGITNGPIAIFILSAGEAGSTIHRRVSGVSIEVLELGMGPNPKENLLMDHTRQPCWQGWAR